MAAPIITVENLSKRYTLGQVHTNLLSERLGNFFRRTTHAAQAPEEFWALRDVNFTVRQGEVVGIIGRNGAGKSTLLKILSRITAPSAGHIEIEGRISSLLEVGTGFHPELTGRENIFLNGAILGMRKEEIRRKFDEIVNFAEVERFLDTPVKRYSSGMYIRLAFAVAAHLEPEILIIDEVLAVGDSAFQKKCLGKMEEVGNSGRTVFFVSHNMASIKKLCSRVLLLEAGCLTREGGVGEMVAHHLACGMNDGAVVEIAPHQHRAGGGVEIFRIELLDERGRAVNQYQYEQAIVIRLWAKAGRPLSQVRFGLALYADGLRLTTAHSPAIATLSSGQELTMTYTIPAGILLPNFYAVHVGAHSVTSGQGLDYVPDAANFRILDFNDQEASLRDEHESGMVRINGHWICEGLSLWP